MTKKSIIRLVLSGALIAGMGVATIAYTTPTAQAAPKKKTAKKKTATAINLAGKTYKGTYYGAGEFEVKISFKDGSACSIDWGGDVYSGTYKVSAKTVTLKYNNTSMDLDIKNGGAKLYYEEAGPRHVYECELNLVP